MSVFLHAKSSLPALYELQGSGEVAKRISLKTSSTQQVQLAKYESRLRRFGVRHTPIHLLVDKAEKRSRAESVESHLWSGKLSPASFIAIGDGLYVSSPEFCFVQMATQLDKIDLIRFGYELCGRYLLNPESSEIDVIRPLTSKRSIERFISRLPKAHGVAAARSALMWVQDGSRSPRETSLSMLLSLPSIYGGRQLGLPELNHQISVGIDVEGNWFRYVDHYWKEKNIGVEYDSDSFHTGADKISRDSVREKVLNDQGVRIIRVTNEELVNPAKFDLFVSVLAKALGKRIRGNSSTIKRKHRALEHRLLSAHQPLW